MRNARDTQSVFVTHLAYSRVFARLTFVLVILTLLQSVCAIAEDNGNKIKVVYLAPETAFFWRNVDSFTFEVARQLDVDIVKVSYEAAFPALKELKRLINTDDKPDYLLFHYFSDIGAQMLDMAEQADVKSFTIITEIVDEQIKKIGLPRGKYKNWIGHMAPDDIQAGRLLTEVLYQHQQEHDSTHPAKLVAVSGDPQASATYYRDMGLTQALQQNPNVELKRRIHTNWSSAEGAFSTYHLLKMFPDTNIIWAVNDSLAVGAIDAVKKAGRKPGEDIYIGGVDWTPRGLKHVAEGNMVTTLGGHHMEAGWGLILLVDYHHGIDFKEEIGLMIRTPLSAITKDNVEAYTSLFPNGDWKNIDAKSYSKYYTPSLKSYDFSITQLLEAEAQR